MATQRPASPPGTVYCRECGKAIEAGARFCRFCGKAQVDRPPAVARLSSSQASQAPEPPASAPPSARPPASGPRPVAGQGLEIWLRQVFPRHEMQDDFMHVGSIAVFLLALIGFVLGFFYSFNFLAVNFLLASVALCLFLILRESTLSQMRSRGGAPSPPNTRSSSGRPPTTDLPNEAATTQSSPPGGRPPQK